MSKYFRLGLIAVIGVSCVLLFLLVLASQNSTFFEKYYITIARKSKTGTKLK